MGEMLIWLCPDHNVDDLEREYGGMEPYVLKPSRARADNHTCSVGTCRERATRAQRIVWVDEPVDHGYTREDAFHEADLRDQYRLD